MKITNDLLNSESRGQDQRLANQERNGVCASTSPPLELSLWHRYSLLAFSSWPGGAHPHHEFWCFSQVLLASPSSSEFLTFSSLSVRRLPSFVRAA